MDGGVCVDKNVLSIINTSKNFKFPKIRCVHWTHGEPQRTAWDAQNHWVINKESGVSLQNKSAEKKQPDLFQWDFQFP